MVRACIDGKRRAFKDLYDYLSPSLFPICLRYANHRDEAQDFLQEGFVKIFENLDRFSFSGSFEGWSKRVIVNYCIEQIRKNHRKIFTVDIDDTYDVGSNAKAIENLEAADILEVISSMPTGYRTVFNLYVIEGFTHKEIAGQLNISENTSKTQLLKARKYLRQRIKNFN